MTLFILISISILIVMTLFILVSYVLTSKYKNMPLLEHFKNSFFRDIPFGLFNTVMCLFLFLIVFITCAATFNTYIDKNNPNYYLNKTKTH